MGKTKYKGNNKIRNDHSLEVFDYNGENLEGQVYYSEEENRRLRRMLGYDSKKYLDEELAGKLKKIDKGLYKVLYKTIPNSIQNYDFYTAFRNVKIAELIEETEGTKEPEETDENKPFLQKITDAVIVPDETQLQRYAGYKKGYTNKVKYPIDWRKTIVAIIFWLFIGFSWAFIAFIIAIFLFGILSLFPDVAKFLIIAGIEALLLFIVIKFVKGKRTRKNRIIKELKNNHPYYKLCDNLQYYSIRHTNILYPVNKIEKRYRKSKKAIEKEWAKYSTNSFTGILYRFKPVNVYVDYCNLFYRYFIEIDYKECFPNYPELQIIEKQTESFILDLGSDFADDKVILEYKKQIRDFISRLLSDRIPDMKVTDISIAIVKV